MERNLEHYRINNVKEKSFPLTLCQALSVYRRIIKCETARTKAATEARCKYIVFCLFLLSCTFSFTEKTPKLKNHMDSSLHYFFLYLLQKRSC